MITLKSSERVVNSVADGLGRCVKFRGIDVVGFEAAAGACDDVGSVPCVTGTPVVDAFPSENCCDGEALLVDPAAA